MKKKLVLVLVAIASFSVFYFSSQKTEAEKLREKHEAYLKQTPYTKTGKLSKDKRKSLGLPPNAYNEQMWHYTLDPNTGRPMPEKAFKIQQNLKAKRKGLRAKTPGDSENQWTDRGPNNLGGRTRGIMFDPNDSEHKRVFAGGVSGGLWVNDDITNVNSSWTLVPGIGANISVTVIIHDPNNSNIFYIGSGESYTSGNAIGRGIWRSTDGGLTWNNIFGGADGTFRSGIVVVNGIFYVNDIVARDNAGVTEVYAAISGAGYRDAGNPNQLTGIDQQGLYKSVDNGNNWNRLDIKEDTNTFVNPNDLEIDLENKIWLATTRTVFGDAGGKIFKSTNGTDFELINTLPSAARTEIEVSSLDANKLWAVVNDASAGQAANIYTTTDGFEKFTQLNEPNDVDEDISETDYTRGQAFYNLPIEVDANDNLFIGGINLFRSSDNGTSWTQLSKWSNNNELRNLNVPLVHADQHAIVFRPDTTNEVVFGNDGGVYYTANILEDITTFDINERNRDYNVTQFYYGAIANSGEVNGDDISGGTQDNGTPVSFNSQANVNSFLDPFGGDGGFTEIDDESGYMIQSYPRNTHNFINYPALTPSTFKQLTTRQEGDDFLGSFINSAVLDKNLDILYSNATLGSDFKIERVSGFLPGETEEAIFLFDDVLNGNPSTIQISPFTTTSSRLYLGLENSKLVRVDNANTETPIFTNISGDDFVGSLSDIEFGTNENEIFITIHNYGVESIWFTNDEGTSWRSLEGNLPDLPVKCMLQNPLNTNELIVGTELGIWKTDDYTIAEPVWEQSFNGMSDVTVVDLDLRTVDNTILATTHGRGLFTSQFTDGTATINDVLSDKVLFTVYPTVSNGNFTIFGKIKMNKTSVKIVSITGKEVFSGSLDFSRNMKQNVSLTAVSGVYIVNLKTSNGEQFSEKIIIR